MLRGIYDNPQGAPAPPQQDPAARGPGAPAGADSGPPQRPAAAFQHEQGDARTAGQGQDGEPKERPIMELRPPLPTAKSAKSFRDKGMGAQVAWSAGGVDSRGRFTNEEGVGSADFEGVGSRGR